MRVVLGELPGDELAAQADGGDRRVADGACPGRRALSQRRRYSSRFFGIGARVYWTIMAAVSWWACTVTLLQYGRGWWAQRRGVPPEQPAGTPNPRQPKWLLIGLGAVACLFTLGVVSHAGRHPDKQTEENALLFLNLFFILLSMYPRGRAEDMPDLDLRVTPDPQTPGSPSQP